MTNPQLSHANCQTSVRRSRVIENPIWSLMNIFYNKPPYRIFLGPQMIVSTEHRTTEHRTQVLQHPTVYGAALFAHPEYDRMDCTYQTMSRWNGTIRISTDGSAVSWPLHIAKRITEFPPNPFAHSSGSSRFAHYGYSCLTELPPRLRHDSATRMIAYSATALMILLDMSVGLAGFLRFGAQTQGNVLKNFGATDILANGARAACLQHPRWKRGACPHA